MMKQPNPPARSIITRASLTMLAATCLSGQAIAETDSQAYAFPDRWMIRLGAYVVDGADTQVSVNSDVGLGTSIDYERDLGGDDCDTIPRIDAYYRIGLRSYINWLPLLLIL